MADLIEREMMTRGYRPPRQPHPHSRERREAPTAPLRLPLALPEPQWPAEEEQTERYWDKDWDG